MTQIYGNFLSEMCYTGDYELVNIIINKYYANLDSNSINNAFYNACSGNNIDIIELLFKKFGNVFNYDEALCISCKNNNINIVKFLLDRNLDLDFDYDNNYAFKIACNKGNVEIVNMLIKYLKHNDIKLGMIFSNVHQKSDIAIATILLDNLPHIKKLEYYERLFKKSCKKNNFEMAKLLKSRIPNIRHRNVNINLVTNEIREWILADCPQNVKIKSARKIV